MRSSTEKKSKVMYSQDMYSQDMCSQVICSLVMYCWLNFSYRTYLEWIGGENQKSTQKILIMWYWIDFCYWDKDFWEQVISQGLTLELNNWKIN